MTTTWQTAPDGRRFRVFTARCFHLDPCWQGRCECGEKLTAHDFEPDEARAGALSVMASDDPRRGFGHPACKASR